MDDVIDDLARQDAAGEAAMLELLLAKDRAVGPMVEALADPDRAAGRRIVWGTNDGCSGCCAAWPWDSICAS